jgi:hypothetical protein
MPIVGTKMTRPIESLLLAKWIRIITSVEIPTLMRRIRRRLGQRENQPRECEKKKSENGKEKEMLRNWMME